MTYKNREVQPELFLRPKKKTTNSVLQGSLFKNSYKPSYNISSDTLVVCIIAGLMFNVIVFAMGMERGKVLNGSAAVIPEEKPQTRMVQAVRPKPQAAAVETQAVKQEITAEEKEPQTKKTETAEEKTAPAENSYIIQLVTYSSDNNAKEEMNTLEQNGISGFVLKKGEYYVVYAGAYPSKSAALEKLNDLKKRYKDCFVKAWKKS